MLLNVCEYCTAGIEYTSVIVGTKHRAICWLCNKTGKHLQRNYVADHWYYDQLQDSFINDEQYKEISRSMLHTILTAK